MAATLSGEGGFKSLEIRAGCCASAANPKHWIAATKTANRVLWFNMTILLQRDSHQTAPSLETTPLFIV